MPDGDHLGAVEHYDPPYVRRRTLDPDSLERLTRGDKATRLHVIDGDQIWLDTDIGICDGLCIGTGNTRAEAIDDAIRELTDRLLDLQAARHALDMRSMPDATGHSSAGL